jgi:hypothetical protein
MTIFSEEYFAQIMFWVKAGTVPTIIYFAPSITLRGHARPMESVVPGSQLCE